MSSKRRYVQVGLGGRSIVFLEAVVKMFRDECELVGLSDSNPGRLAHAAKWAADHGVAVPQYPAEQFDKMIAEARPDVVIVTTKDCFHDQYICRAMELGCDVITEKPMTMDATKCQRIIDTQKKTGRHCTVTFNYRYSPPRTQVKELLMSGAIGEVLSVDFHWLLNTSHGADYFRRWHRNKENSGGLMVHKATHHFDMVNWWLSAVPKKVFALGHRKFYTPEYAERSGLTNRGERCLNCADAKKCFFYLDLNKAKDLKELYLDNEQYDGYYRDRCVFSDKIDIEDSMNVVVEYDTGAKLSYSLNAFCPWEGYIVSFNGTNGRLEHVCHESTYINGDGNVPGELLENQTTISVLPHYDPWYNAKLWTGTGGHGGGDPVMLSDIFSSKPSNDKYMRKADQRGGAYSILTGVAANRSMATGQAICIDDLVKNIGQPDYPKMPDRSTRIVMKERDTQFITSEEADRRRAAK